MNIKSKWLKAFLAGSLALNLAFIITFSLRYFDQPGKKPPGIKEVAFDTSLGLTPEQKRHIATLTDDFKEKMVDFKHQMLEKRMDIFDELGDPEFDLDSLNAKVTELNELETKLTVIFVDSLVSITNIMDARQRISFLYNLSRSWFFIDRKGKRRR